MRRIPIKLVYKTEEIPHLWAHQTVDYARNPQGNYFFEGDTIYSYGKHFPIARIVTRNGKTAVLMTIQHWSATTAQHVHWTREAVKDRLVFDVDDPRYETGVMAGFKERAKRLWEIALKKRDTRESGLEDYRKVIETANRYAEFAGLKTRLKLHKDFEIELAKAKELTARAQERLLERKRRRYERMQQQREAQQKKLATLMPLWEAGEVPTSDLPAHENAHLRLSKDKKRIETSQGANVPISHSVPFWKRIMANWGKPTLALENSDVTVGGYPVRKIAGDGDVQIGCHTIKFEQIRKIAIQLGLINEETDIGATGETSPAAA